MNRYKLKYYPMKRRIRNRIYYRRPGFIRRRFRRGARRRFRKVKR